MSRSNELAPSRGGMKPPLRPPCAFAPRDRPFAGLGARAFAAVAVMLSLLAGTPVLAQERYPGVGRAATAAEIAAWDIDVRGDFRGLPKGSGSVKLGEEVWEAKCASCHGSFGESNTTFPPIIGGTKPADVERGRVASLLRPDEQRTTMMKLSRVSALWDYINRAMPFNASKTLTVAEVYAATAYILHMADLVPADFTLSDANIAEVQKRLPNRDGLKPHPGLWNVRGAPDVRNTRCMRDCGPEPVVASEIPPGHRGAHGELAEQQRPHGPVRGTAVASARTATALRVAGADELAKKYACVACHAASARMVGPAWREIADKYRNDSVAEVRLAAKVRAGGAGIWGSVPMPPHPGLPEAEMQQMLRWILAGAK